MGLLTLVSVIFHAGLNCTWLWDSWRGDSAEPRLFASSKGSMNNRGKIKVYLLRIAQIVAPVKGLIFYCIFQ